MNNLAHRPSYACVFILTEQIPIKWKQSTHALLLLLLLLVLIYRAKFPSQEVCVYLHSHQHCMKYPFRRKWLKYHVQKPKHCITKFETVLDDQVIFNIISSLTVQSLQLFYNYSFNEHQCRHQRDVVEQKRQSLPLWSLHSSGWKLIINK